MRIVALLATYNERRFIRSCLQHLTEQGIDIYLIDNGSTDDTVEQAECWLGRGLIGIESFPRGAGDTYDWRSLLRRKEALAQELDADWFMHVDADEIRLPPSRGQTLAQCLEDISSAGFNALNFIEFTFLPTKEAPDHDHADFQGTLRTYYPFAPRFPHQLKAWMATDQIELAWSGGHQARFPGLKMYPQSYLLKHYLFLSIPHAVEKYVERRYDQDEVEAGWHGWRAHLSLPDIRLPGKSEMRFASSSNHLDASQPRSHHYLDFTRDLQRK